jgi:hypothetical protein
MLIVWYWAQTTIEVSRILVTSLAEQLHNCPESLFPAA